VPSTGPERRYDIHEELWVFDHENLPISGECSPVTAKEIAEGIEAVPDHIPRAAVLAYLDNEGTTGTDWDSLGDRLEECYRGEWSDIGDYAYELFRDTAPSREAADMIDSWPFTHVDWERAGEDLRIGGDIWYVDSPDHGIFVFDNN
jgi:antirestriction protein